MSSVSNIIVWSKNNCPHCTQAKEMLASKQLGFEEKKIGRDVTKQDLLEAVPNAKTVPQIFMYGKHIGGLTDLKKYFEDHDMWRGD